MSKLIDLGADRSISVRDFMQQVGITDALKSDVTDIAINGPGGIWLQSSGVWVYKPDDKVTMTRLLMLAKNIAVFNNRVLDEGSPLLSATLPDGERCQIARTPACLPDTISITIRKPSSSRFSLQQYADTGRLSPRITSNKETIEDWECELLELSRTGNFIRFFELAVEHKLNFVTVGGTGSGKTTFSKTIVDLIPPSRRMFTVENVPELDMPKHPNQVRLLFGAGLSAKHVLQSCMRMKPDHIFVTELLGDESWDYLMALKSGHSCSVTSIHANDCHGALYKIGSYIKQSEVGKTLDFDYIMQEVKTTIDVVLYFSDTKLREFYYDPHEKLRLMKGAKK